MLLHICPRLAASRSEASLLVQLALWLCATIRSTFFFPFCLVLVLGLVPTTLLLRQRDLRVLRIATQHVIGQDWKLLPCFLTRSREQVFLRDAESIRATLNISHIGQTGSGAVCTKPGWLRSDFDLACGVVNMP